MELSALFSPLIDFVRANHAWAAPVVFLLAFFESLAFLSLLVPATAILVSISALVGAAGVSFWPLWLAGVVGSVLGYTISYQIGVIYGERAFHVWPFRQRPSLIVSSRNFFAKYGVMAVFIGHFFGPVRAVIPVVAGVYAVPRGKFELANVAASSLWAASVLSPGFVAGGSEAVNRMLMLAK